MNVPSLGEFELAALIAVARLGDDAFGAEVRRFLHESTGREHSVGAVYTTLQRLHDKALLQSFESEPAPVRGGRSRRCFQLTLAGRRTLHEVAAARQKLWGNLDLGLGNS